MLWSCVCGECIFVSQRSCGVFFLQAEDGIRDLVRSRGLGDVYKRQEMKGRYPALLDDPVQGEAARQLWDDAQNMLAEVPVSYTHLTLPTSDLV